MFHLAIKVRTFNAKLVLFLSLCDTTMKQRRRKCDQNIGIAFVEKRSLKNDANKNINTDKCMPMSLTLKRLLQKLINTLNAKVAII